MFEFFSTLPMEVQVMVAALIGMFAGMFFCWFGEVLTPDDLI